MAATKNKHILWFQVVGAAPAAQKTKNLSREVKNLKQAMTQLKAGMLGMRGLMIGAAGSMVALGLGIRRTVTAYADYSRAQAQLRTTLAATTNAQRQNARISSAVAERAAINLGYSTTEANTAMTTMIQTGIGVHASMRLIGSSLRLARVAEMDTDNATRFLVDTMNMFRGEMASQNITLREFADQMSGQLAVAANMASTNIEQLQQAFRYAGTEMSALGYRSHEVMSALAGLSVVGLRGTTAGTRLRGAVAALIRPSRQVQEQIDRVTQGTSSWSQIVHDEHGNLRRLPDLMAQLMQVMARLPTQQQRAQLEVAIFGRRALAAGISLSEYNEAARRMLRINTEIQDRGNVTSRIMRMEEERMRGFHMQVEQLKNGLTDLAIAFGEILFGAMETNREGFGTYVREIARAIRVMGMLEDGHEDMRDELNEMSPRVRENATQIREFMLNLAELVKALGWVAKQFMWLVTNYPRATAVIIGLRVAFGGFLPMISSAAPLFARLSSRVGVAMAEFRLMTPMVGRLQSAFTAFKPVFAALILEIGGRGATALRDWGLANLGMTRDMERLRETTVASHSEWVRSIPVIGHLAAMYVDLAGAIQRAWQITQEITGRRTRERDQTVMTSASTMMRRRMEQLRASPTAEGMSPEAIRNTAYREQRQLSLMRTAQLMYAQGRTGRESIGEQLSTVGMTGHELRQTIDTIRSFQRNMGEADREAGRTLAEGGMLSEAVEASSRQLAGFGIALEQMSRTISLPAGGSSLPGYDVVPEETMNMSIPTAQDAYVNRGGLMGVSSGDIIVSRRHLANAVLARQGAMAGPAVSMAGEGMMAGPTPTVPGGGGGTMNISIPVMLDGREIARAVGRANVTQLERGGGRLPPGQRRSLRETGFSRSV